MEVTDMIRMLISAAVLGIFLGSAVAQESSQGSATTVQQGPAVPDSTRRSDPEHRVPSLNDSEMRQLPESPQTPTLPEQPAEPVQPAR
jgi:hypothetical protein